MKVFQSASNNDVNNLLIVQM